MTTNRAFPQRSRGTATCVWLRLVFALSVGCRQRGIPQRSNTHDEGSEYGRNSDAF
jgi:hypothetical protein